MKNLQLMLTGREVSKAENKKGLSQATTLTPDKVSTTARLWLDYGSTTARVWKYAAMLLMVLTIGVGEMWGDDGDFYNMYISYSFGGASGSAEDKDNGTGLSKDLGTLSSGSFTLTGVYLKCWDDWGSSFKSSGGQLCYTNKGGSTQYVSCTRGSKSGNNYEYKNTSPGVTLASYTDASGSYAFECWGQTWGWGDRYFPKSAGHYVLNYKIAPPEVSSFAVSTTGSSSILSGTGTSEDPYIISYNGSLKLTLSGSKAHTDANSSLQYYTNSAWNTTTNRTISNITSTVKTSVTVKMRCYNSTASLSGTESSKTIYYQSEPSYTVSFTNDGNGSTSPSSNQTVGSISGVAISASADDDYEFNNWTITSGTGSFDDATDESTTFYPTANATIQANFRSTATSTLTVTATAGGSITTPAAGYYSDISATSYTITASRTEGYKFTGWTQSGDGAVTFGNASSLSTTATVTTVDNVTVTANFAAMSNSLSVSSSTLYAGDNITLTATKTNHTLDLTYQYKIGSGAWTDIATQSGTSKTWQIPYANTYQTYKFRVKSTDGSADIISSEQTVNVKGRIIIHVKNTNSWASMYLYSWYSTSTTTNGAWPGTTGSGSNGQSCTIHTTGSLWWDVTITQTTANAQKFILNCNTSGNQNQTNDLTLSSFTHDAYYEMSTNASDKQTLSSTTTPAAPTLSTSAASYIASTSATLGGNVTNLGNDIISERGYYWSTNSTLSSSNLGVGTKVTVSGTQSSTGTFNSSKTGLTNGTTYYFIAYAKNGYGTSYGSVNNFRTMYITTVTLNMQGGSGGTSSVSATEGSAMPSGKTAPGKTGYAFGGYYASAGGSGTQYYNASMGSAHAWDVAAATATIHAKWTAKTYDVTLNVNGGSGANQTVTATYDAGMPTTLKGGGAIAARSRTGYNFAGYAQNSDGSGTLYYTSALANNHNWDQDVVSPVIYAKWTAKQSALTLDYQTDATGYGSNGSISNTVGLKGTYDAAMTTLTGTMPTAANGYAFMGFYDATGGGGTKYYNADGSSAHNWDKDTESGTTLYAYYKKAEITALTFDNVNVETSSTVGVTPTISPTPTGDYKICWRVLHNNGNEITPQPEISWNGTKATFTSAAASGTYKVEAKLYTGTVCGSGTLLDTRIGSFQVAGVHDVTIQYKCGDEVIKTSMVITGRPLAWSDEINPADIFGYTFSGWTAGDGVTITDDDGSTTKTSTTEATIKIKATYDGTLTAEYTQKSLIYFKNTLGWSSVYVNFLSEDGYWAYGGSAGKGSGNSGVTNKNLAMNLVEGTTDVYYYDYGSASITPTKYVSFTQESMDGYDFFYQESPGFAHVVYPTRPSDNLNSDDKNGRGFYAGTPMFVPRAVEESAGVNQNNERAKYYNDGYWTKYTSGTGYTLEVYNTEGNVLLKSVAFTSLDELMPMKATADLEAGITYKFQLKRDGDVYYGNSGIMTYANHGQSTAWEFTNSGFTMCRITTNAAGNYTFNLSYSANNSDQYRLRIAVDYPVASGDYRIMYQDLAKWSQTSNHLAAWGHPSSVIPVNSSSTETKADTVSLYVAYGSSPSAKFQKATVDEETGAVTWEDVEEGTVNLSSITSKGVYNFIVSQTANGSAISLTKTEAYTGSYYIRTDCAGGGKWDNFRGDINHLMTYSDYAAVQSAAASDAGFTHYFVHWVTSGTNVKYTIANDYSECVSDSLAADLGTVIADISEGGDLNSASANVRFMWNQLTNKLSRAYIAGSGYITDKFLVLEGDSKLFDETGNTLTGANRDHRTENHGSGDTDYSIGADYQLILNDDENFVYERTIQVNTGAQGKLTAKYNDHVQYFIGAADATVELLGGEAEGKYNMRIIYDFKTNRLVTAYIPSDADITANLAIHADIMLVREHQNAGQQLTFSGSGKLSDVKTVYGVMRFNRWTLNNKSTEVGHSPLGDPKSSYERGLYWISFPFNVKLSDVFGFGTYGTHWIIMEYDGAERASTGYWADSQGFWKHVTNRTNKTLEAGKGYVLALDLDLMRDNNTEFWKNDIQQVELFFPSATNVSSITETSVNITVPSHECTIGPRPGQTDDRTKKDSHWNIIGVPSYANYSSTLTDGSSTITWKSDDLPYLYEWNSVDNTYTAQSGTTYPFKAMHSYMVQYHGTLHWTNVSATPSAPARVTSAPTNVEFRLELQQNADMIDQTFVKMTNDEAITANFDFNKDLCKEMNKGKANIYTMVEGYIQTAGNCLPMSEQTTIVPVGVKIATNDDYTFSIPDGTSGVGVTLIDQQTGVRTNLSALDYTVSLEAGTYNERFVLEISPISQVITNIESTNGDKNDASLNGARKQLIDGLLYIIRDGKMYDARGARVE